MRRRCLGGGHLADGFTFPLVVRACSSISDPLLCRIVHGHAVAAGCQFHLHVANELILMYGRIGRMDYARGVFDKMPHRTVVSCNTLMSGFTSNLDCQGALRFFLQMQSDGPQPNPVTWTSLLSVHARCRQHHQVMELFCKMRAHGTGATPEAVSVVLSTCADSSVFIWEGRGIHCYAIKSGLDEYVFVRNSLICLHGKMGGREGAEAIFSNTKAKTLVTWNALLSCYVEAGLFDEAYQLFSCMEHEENHITPNVVSWSVVIAGFASGGMVRESLQLFCQMQEAGVSPNAVTIAGVLSACAQLAALHLGRQVHGHLIRGLMDKTLLVGNGLLHMYCRCGSLAEGRLVFNHMEERDLISWNTMISGYGMNGFCKDALCTFNGMEAAAVQPDGITFVAVLSACSHAGFVPEGRWLFDQMVGKYKISPGVEHYACMVDLLGRAGLLKEASKTMERMPMNPNICVWGALLNSYRIQSDVVLTEEIAASRILTLQQQQQPEERNSIGSYMLLSNVYAACEKWEESARIKLLSRENGVRKIPGQSWIEVKGSGHAF